MLLRMISEQLHFAPVSTGKLSENDKTLYFINATYQFYVKIGKNFCCESSRKGNFISKQMTFKKASSQQSARVRAVIDGFV